MVNKKGYIRTLEAVIAIVIIFVFILSILPQRESEEQTPKDIDLTATQILNEIQNNEDYRDLVSEIVLTSTEIDENYEDIKENIDLMKPMTIDYELVVCNNENCYPDDPSTILEEKKLLNIYTKSIIIKTDSGDMRVVKLLLWRRA